jgi:peptidoglycan/xylan/chitin deacetylase (PgdA/CDA1 family)
MDPAALSVPRNFRALSARWASFCLAGLLVLPVVAVADVAVLMYHRFGEDAYPATNVRLDAFEAQLAQIEALELEVVPLATVVAALRGEAELPDRAVALTIDDAYASIHSEAWPRLLAAAMPVTVFVATDPVDEGFGDYLTWDQLRELAAGGMTVANHGASHASLPRRPGESEASHQARVRQDLLRGASRLREELGDSSALFDDVFAYPYGEYDAAVAEVVESLGWIAFGQHSGAIGPLSDRRALPRYPVNEAYSDPDALRTKLRSRALPVERIEPWDPVSSSTPVLDVWLAEASANGPDPSRLACFVSGQGAVPVEWIEPGRQFRVVPPQPLRPGRSRVNCTLPGPDGRYAWYSHQWLVQAER